MRKLFFTAVVAVVMMTSMNAQTFGVKAGANFANFTGSAIGDTSMKIGAYLGGFVDFEVSDEFSVQPELVFSMQGAQDSNDSAFKMNLNYLNLPVMAKYEVAEGFSLVAGPQIGFLLSAKISDGDNSTDIKDNLKGIDFGLGFGAEYELESGLQFSARYNLGLSSLDDTGSNQDVKNGVIQVGLGYSFN
ncbi:MAG TPA: PorT family protein [Flavobacteriia bacterium]|jgi:opacity protein-like surface antigen|nr:PorT family protein [Flavobacteriia bacterium]